MEQKAMAAPSFAIVAATMFKVLVCLGILALIAWGGFSLYEQHELEKRVDRELDVMDARSGGTGRSTLDPAGRASLRKTLLDAYKADRENQRYR